MKCVTRCPCSKQFKFQLYLVKMEFKPINNIFDVSKIHNSINYLLEYNWKMLHSIKEYKLENGEKRIRIPKYRDSLLKCESF